MISAERPLLLIGCGNMGRAMLEGWCRGGVDPSHAVVVHRHPDALKQQLSLNGITIFPSIDDMPRQRVPSVICLAIKPAGLAELLPILASRFETAPLLLSVIAGKMTLEYETTLGSHWPIIRIMPNTPIAIGHGMSGCFANSNATNEHRAFVDRIMQPTGAHLWLESEAQMHAFTGVAGSGPAYIFYLLECLCTAAREQGFSDEDARTLSVNTMLGAAQLAANSQESLAQLRQNVTSPNGTTQAGLEVLMHRALEEIFSDTVTAAKARSETLAAST